MNRITRYLFVLLIGGLTSCGSKSVKMGGKPAEDAAVAAIVASHTSATPNFRTVQGKLDLEYQSAERSHNVTVTFRMKKNDTIWMSGQFLGIPLAKVMITPQKVLFYEKISKTYFDGDFRLISDLLGTPLNFDQVQNLLLGQALYDLGDEPLQLVQSEKGYQLTPVAEGFLKKLFLLDPATYKVLATQISQPSRGRSLMLSYPGYQDVQGRIFPEKVEILSSEGSENTRIDIHFRSLEFNEPVSFPFSIPSGYEEITVE